jgi:hypothetical protein
MPLIGLAMIEFFLYLVVTLM